MTSENAYEKSEVGEELVQTGVCIGQLHFLSHARSSHVDGADGLPGDI